MEPSEMTTPSRVGAAVWQFGVVFGLAAAIAVTISTSSPANAQSCDVSQTELTRAIVDSQTALDQIDTTINRFDVALRAVDRNTMDPAAVTNARQSADEYLGALSDFQAQIQPLGDACGPSFTNDSLTMSDLINRFVSQRDRADRLLGEFQALVDSGEPALTQEQREAVQVYLVNQGHYQSAIDGQFGDGTRAAIRSWQSTSGYPATGYLTGPQAELVLASPAASQTPPQVDVTGLPAAPRVGAETPQQPVSPADAAAQRICSDNLDQVATATERARTYRQEVEASLRDLRNALRAPREPDFDLDAAERISGEVDTFLGQLSAFRDQADGVVGQCGDEFDGSVAVLVEEVNRLGAAGAQADRIAADFDVLQASGEPPLTAEEMRQIQQGLTNRGHYRGAIDALFGPGTRNAVRAYQAEMGYRQTGYLTPQQVAELRRAAVTPAATAPEQPEVVEAPAAEPAPSTIEPTTIEPTAISARAHARVSEDLAQRMPLEPTSEVEADDGQFGAWWWQLRDAIAEGDARVVADRRYDLIGAAFMEHGANSPAMVDALVLVGDGFARLGLYADAELHYQRAYDQWTALDLEDGAAQAALLERLVAVRLMQAAEQGPIGNDDFAALAELLNEAWTAADAGDAASPLPETILARMADLNAAAGRIPSDANVEAAFQARYMR